MKLGKNGEPFHDDDFPDYGRTHEEWVIMKQEDRENKEIITHLKSFETLQSDTPAE